MEDQLIENYKMKKIPKEITDVLQNSATKYSQSPSTTNAGKILRLIASIVPVDIVIKIFAHKLSK